MMYFQVINFRLAFGSAQSPPGLLLPTFLLHEVPVNCSLHNSASNTQDSPRFQLTPNPNRVHADSPSGISSLPDSSSLVSLLRMFPSLFNPYNCKLSAFPGPVVEKTTFDTSFGFYLYHTIVSGQLLQVILVRVCDRNLCTEMECLQAKFSSPNTSSINARTRCTFSSPICTKD